MENVNPQLEIIAVELQVPETVAQTISTNLQTYFDKHQEWKGMIESLKINSIEDVGNMAVARQIRLDLKRKRVEAEKLVDASRDKVKAKMSNYVLEDKLWLKSGQIIKALFEDLEDKAKAIEDYAENELKKKKLQLEQDRTKLLEPYAEIINADRYDLQNMPENEFGILLTGIQHSFDELLKKRKEEAEKEQRTQKRKDDLLLAGLKFDGQAYNVITQKELIPFFDSEILPDMTDDDFNSGLCKANELIEAERQRVIEVEKELQKKKDEDELRNARLLMLSPATYNGLPPNGSVMYNGLLFITDSELIGMDHNKFYDVLTSFKKLVEKDNAEKAAKELDQRRRMLIEPYLKYVPKQPDDYSHLTEKQFKEMLSSVSELDRLQNELDEKIAYRRKVLFETGYADTGTKFVMQHVGELSYKKISGEEPFSDQDFESFISDSKKVIAIIEKNKEDQEKLETGSDKEKLIAYMKRFSVEPPELKNKKSKAVLTKFDEALDNLLIDFKIGIDKL